MILQNNTLFENSSGTGGGAVYSRALDTDIYGQGTQASSELDVIIAGTSGNVKRTLEGASRQVKQAIRSNYWISDNDLSERRGILVFNKISLALNQIECARMTG